MSIFVKNRTQGILTENVVYKVLWHLSYLPQCERGFSEAVKAPQALETELVESCLCHFQMCDPSKSLLSSGKWGKY